MKATYLHIIVDQADPGPIGAEACAHAATHARPKVHAREIMLPLAEARGSKGENEGCDRIRQPAAAAEGQETTRKGEEDVMPCFGCL
jgi:hypothetical protein